MMSDPSPTELHARHDELAERLTLLVDTPELDEELRELAGAWRDRLESVRTRALAPIAVAFIAEVGCGKTSLIAAATGLRLPVQGSPRKWSVLPVGDGRTTLGETRIGFEDREDILLEVEPVPADELAMELRLFAQDSWKTGTGTDGSQPGEELYRLLRAWIAPGDQPRDEIARLASECDDVASFEQVLRARLDLEQRSTPYQRRFAIGQLAELRRTLRELMRGELPEAPVPRLVRLRLPTTELGAAVHEVIDTQGVDAPGLLFGRSDLVAQIQDPDTLLVLCSRFEAAPDGASMSVLAALDELTPVSASTRSLRLVIIDRRELDDDPDERAGQARARDERISQCIDRLRRAGRSLGEGSVLAIDARSDAGDLRDVLVAMANEERSRRRQTWGYAQYDAESVLLALEEEEVVVQARQREIDLRLWWEWDAALAVVDGLTEADGLTAIADQIARRDFKHWSHLNAAIRRRGRYTRLNLRRIGAVNACRANFTPYYSASRAFKKFGENPLIENSGLAQHVGLRRTQLEGALDVYNDWLSRMWHRTLAEYFDSPRSDELWNDCKARWGQGSGYVEYIAARFREEAKRAALHVEHRRLQRELEDRLPRRPDLFTLRSVRLQNFRGVADRTIPITDTITVLIGDNGLGKTCWLEAIAAAVGAMLPAMDAGSAPRLSNDDVRQTTREIKGIAERQLQLPMQIEVEATLQGRSLSWIRQKQGTNSDATTEGEGLLLTARQVGEDVRAHDHHRQLPILAYYGTQRLWPPDLEPDAERREVGNRLDGYRDCLEAASNHGHMLDWMHKYTLVELQEGKPVVQLRAIERAVVSCVEGAERFHYDVKHAELVLTMRDGQRLPFRMLSDGYRNVVAMVADIAWRASVLNPQIGERAPALAEGVVLIDEIDLHLHPNWQRRVLADLRRAFPRLQFVTTTHSPFIIQSLEHGQLVNLDPDAEDVPYANESPEDIAEHVMGVDVPQRSERRRREAEAAERYYTLLDQLPDVDEAELARLKAELDELTAPYAENQAFVAFLERKRALAEARRA
jgi:predicted ATP-binding protein involved in virulence